MQHSTCRSETKNNGEWVLMSSHLVVREPNGKVICPTAEMVYRVCVEGLNVDGLPSFENNRNLVDLTFSRYPLRPVLVIEENTKDTEMPLQLTIHLIDNNKVVPLSSISHNTPDHLVVDQCWYPLVPGSLDEVREDLKTAEVKCLGVISLRQYLNLLRLSSDRTLVCDNVGQYTSASQYKATPGFTPSPHFVGTLFEYQKDGLRWLYTITSQAVGGILADEMGLGKTIQIIALLAKESFENRVPSLVVAPGTLLENWRREVKLFAPNLKTILHRGAGRTGFPSKLALNDLILTSYDTLIRDLSLFKTIDWNLVILDEAQAIKNPDTLRASAVKQLPKRVAIAVTGTPVENRLRDLWSITDFAVPGLLGTQSDFESTFVENVTGAQTLEPRVSPVLLRRLVTEVADDLPERIEIPQALEFDHRHAEAYDQIRQDTIDEYGDNATLVALTRLRMYCTHPFLIHKSNDDPIKESKKYLRLTEILEEIFANREKVVLFTSYNKMTDIVVSDVAQRFDVYTYSIDGRTPIEERQSIIDELGGRTESALLVLNPKAAGTGLNITSANHVIHYNLEWNPAVEDQASARVYRRGQKRPVMIHRLFYINTVEEVIDVRLTRKRHLAKTAVVGTEGSDDNVEDVLRALRKSPLVREDNEYRRQTDSYY